MAFHGPSYGLSRECAMKVRDWWGLVGRKELLAACRQMGRGGTGGRKLIKKRGGVGGVLLGDFSLV